MESEVLISVTTMMTLVDASSVGMNNPPCNPVLKVQAMLYTEDDINLYRPPALNTASLIFRNCATLITAAQALYVGVVVGRHLAWLLIHDKWQCKSALPLLQEATIGGNAGDQS